MHAEAGLALQAADEGSLDWRGIQGRHWLWHLYYQSFGQYYY